MDSEEMKKEEESERPTSTESTTFPGDGIIDLGERVKAFLNEAKQSIEQDVNSEEAQEQKNGDQIMADMKSFIADNFDDISKTDESIPIVKDDLKERGDELLKEAEEKVGIAVESAAEKLDEMKKLLEPEKEAIEEMKDRIEEAENNLEEAMCEVMQKAEGAVEHISERLETSDVEGQDTVVMEKERVEEAIKEINETAAREGEELKEATEELAEKLSQVRDEAQTVLKEVEEMNTQIKPQIEEEIQKENVAAIDQASTALESQAVIDEYNHPLTSADEPESRADEKMLDALLNEDTEETIRKFAQSEAQALRDDIEGTFTKIEHEVEAKFPPHEETPARFEKQDQEATSTNETNEITANIEVFEGEDPNAGRKDEMRMVDEPLDTSTESSAITLGGSINTVSSDPAITDVEEPLAQVVNAATNEFEKPAGDSEKPINAIETALHIPSATEPEPIEKPVERIIEQPVEEHPAMPRSEEDENLDSIAELSEHTQLRFLEGHESQPKRAESFSSIASIETRQQFKTAIENLKEVLPFGEEENLSAPTDREKTPQKAMDSPNADLSPNAPPQKGFEDLVHQQTNQGDNLVPPAPGQTSTEGSIDSTGFEKVEHDILDQYSQEFRNQLNQAAFGKLPDDPDNRTRTNSSSGEEDTTGGFVIVPHFEESTEKSTAIKDDSTGAIADNDAIQKSFKMSNPRDDVIEKDYSEYMQGHGMEMGKGRESPTDETAKRIVYDAMQAARERMGDSSPQQNIRSVDDYFPDPVQPQQAHQDLIDIRDDLQARNTDFLPEPPKHENIHADVDDYLQKLHENDDLLEKAEPHKHDYDLDLDDEPDFRNQTPEETTYDRQGPLTIPQQYIPEEDELINPNHFRHGFETEPRPPTPPKELSDEDIQPPVIDLGPPSHGRKPSLHHEQPHHSILKHSHSHSHGEPWFDFKTVDPRVLDIIYWRDPKKSGIALALCLLALFILGRYPILSVIAYTGLAVLAATLGFRIYKAIEGQIKKTGSENPFQQYLSQDLSLPQDRVHSQVDVLVEHGTCLANQLKKLIFVENIVESVKFGLLLWSLTYIASWFSGFTLALLTILGIFSIPKFYETYQEPIDHHLGIVKGHIDNVVKQLEEKVPFLRRAQVEAEKKDQ